jgi:hypothetical protein
VFFRNVVCILLHCLCCLGSMLMNLVWLLAILSLHQPLYGSCCFYRLWLLTEPFCYCKPPCAILRETRIIFGFIAYCSRSYFFLYYIFFRLDLLLGCLPCLVSSCFSSLSLYLNQKKKEKKSPTNLQGAQNHGALYVAFSLSLVSTNRLVVAPTTYSFRFLLQIDT